MNHNHSHTFCDVTATELSSIEGGLRGDVITAAAGVGGFIGFFVGGGLGGAIGGAIGAGIGAILDWIW